MIHPIVTIIAVVIILITWCIINHKNQKQVRIATVISAAVVIAHSILINCLI